MENVRRHIDIQFVITDEKWSHLWSESNYHITKWFSEDLLAIEMKNIKVKIHKPVYLGLSTL